MIVDIDYLEWLCEERAKINKEELENITFVKDGKVIEIDKSVIEDFLFTGLNNVDFITSGFYKGLHENKS